MQVLKTLHTVYIVRAENSSLYRKSDMYTSVFLGVRVRVRVRDINTRYEWQ